MRRYRGRICALEIPWHAERAARWLVRASGGPVSRKDIAEVYGVSAERVRQIEEQALDKLRNDGGGRALLAAYEERRPGVWDEIGMLETGQGLSEGHGGRTKKTA